MPTVHKTLIVICLIVTLFYLLGRLLNWKWEDKEAEQRLPVTRQPRQPKPKCEDDCIFCRMEKNSPMPTGILRPMPQPWSEVRSPKGRKKEIDTKGYACHNPTCAYYGITDAEIHAVVGYGTQGKTEAIQDFWCQACKSKFSCRRHTPLYRLRTPMKTVVLALGMLAEGMDISAVERLLAISEFTLRVWLTRAGMHAEALHKHYFKHLMLHHLQLDELYVKLRNKSGSSWLWTIIDTITKIVPVVLLAPRTIDSAYQVAHLLKFTLAPNCVPAFSTDGLKHYFSVLTAHFGSWQSVEGKSKLVWVLAADFMHAQLKKSYRRMKLTQVDRSMLWGDPETFKQRLQEIGLSGLIQTAFVERFNLTLRHAIAPLARLNWGAAFFPDTLSDHIHWALAYYHFARPHASLRIHLTQPIERKGKQSPRRFAKCSPAMAANFTDHIWSVQQILSYPLPKAWA